MSFLSLGMGNSSSSEQSRIPQQFEELKDPKTGLVTRSKFHDSLAAIETRGFRRLRETPIADLLFDCLAACPEGLTAREFTTLFHGIFSENRNERIDLTFRALAFKTPNTPHLVAVRDVVSLIESCWRLAGQILIDRRHLKKRTVGGEDISRLISNFVENSITGFSETVESQLQSCCDGKGTMTKDQFAVWLSEDRTVKLSVESDTVEVPTSFAYVERATAYPKLIANKKTLK